MTAPNADRIIAGYWARLETALVEVPAARRQELRDEIRTHISESRSRLAGESDADLLNILDRLGDPAEVAAAELEAVQAPAVGRTSWALEIAAIIALVLFWPVGVVLLWLSKAWTTRQKLIGTLVPPGGYLAFVILVPGLALGTFGVTCHTMSDDTGRILSSTCPSGGEQTAVNIGIALLVVIYLVGPLLTAGFLATRLRRSEHDTHADQSPPPQTLVDA